MRREGEKEMRGGGGRGATRGRVCGGWKGEEGKGV